MRVLTGDDRVVVYQRPGCHVCARVKDHLTTLGVPYELRDVDRDPLTPKELWDLFNLKADRLRVPFTVLNDGEDVVLGFDPLRLEGVFTRGELGGAVRSDLVEGTHVHDPFDGPALDPDLWRSAVRGRDAAGATTAPTTESTTARLRVSGGLMVVESDQDVRYLAARRYASPPGSVLTAELDATVSSAAGPADAPAAGVGGAELWLRDEPTGVAIGFVVSAAAVLAVHEREHLAGVTRPAEAYRHQVLTDVSPSLHVRHGYRLVYEHARSRASWFVDDRLVYEAVTPLAVEGWSPAVGLRAGTGPAAGTSTTLTAAPWRVGTTSTAPPEEQP